LTQSRERELLYFGEFFPVSEESVPFAVIHDPIGKFFAIPGSWVSSWGDAVLILILSGIICAVRIPIDAVVIQR